MTARVDHVEGPFLALHGDFKEVAEAVDFNNKAYAAECGKVEEWNKKPENKDSQKPMPEKKVVMVSLSLAKKG